MKRKASFENETITITKSDFSLLCGALSVAVREKSDDELKTFCSNCGHTCEHKTTHHIRQCVVAGWIEQG